MDKDEFNQWNDKINKKINQNYIVDLISKANQTVRTLNLKLRRKQMKDKIDKDYFNVLNGNINFEISDKDYFNLITTKANQTIRPLTLKLRMKQMKDKMEEEIIISKMKHESNQSQQNNDEFYKNIFFLHKKRKNTFNNKSMNNHSEALSPLTQRNFTQQSPKRLVSQFNKTMLPSSPIVQTHMTKVQRYSDYLKINQQIMKHKGQLNEQILNLLEEKVHIAKSFKQSCTKLGVDSYDQTLKTIQDLKYNITQKVIKECNTIYQEKQNHKLNILEKTYTHFLKVLDVIKQMDDELYQYMLNYKFKNQFNDQNTILEDINQMRDDAYNEKVRTFRKEKGQIKTQQSQSLFLIYQFQLQQLKLMNFQATKKRGNSQIESQQNQIAELQATSFALQQKVEDLQKEIKELQSQNHKLNHHIKILKDQNDDLKFAQQKEATFMIEVEHLRTDNQRLITLLGSQDKDLRFLSSLETQKSDLPECLLWVPQKAFEIAHQFREKYKDSDYLGDKQIQLLLFELNKVWAVRQFEQQKLQNSINNLEKQKIQSKTNVPYSEFQLSQQVERLKKQIKELKKENLDLYANRPERGTRSIRIASANNTRK
ncbi:unnamed protein product [Paramecium primaurelia]|uniref:Uncharacterized protein n=1 Tax=Paramecium primaurelia TaxID=5886 RepID=A0A8S1MCS7_PARPR|nr:unnamed protein product [Paramecium primaurelia]